MKRTILFDMDGVLVDTRPIMKIAWTIVAKKYNINKNFEDYLEHIGIPFEEIMRNLKVEEQNIQGIKKLYGGITMEHIENVKPYRGIGRLIQQLHSRGCNVGIVTSKEFWRADYIADKLRFCKEVLVTPEMTKHGKPSGEPLEYAMGLLGSNKQDSVYVGDMQSDYESANNASIDFVHARWGYGQLKKGTRSIGADNGEELYELLQSL